MSCMASSAADNRSSVGRQISFWLQHQRIEQLQELADQRGITRNAMLSVIIDEYQPES